MRAYSFGREARAGSCGLMRAHPIAAHAGRNFQDGLHRSDHVGAALALDSPLTLGGKLSRDVERAISVVAYDSHAEVRALWEETPKGLRGRAA